MLYHKYKVIKMRAIINGKIVLENSVLENGCIIFDDKIQQIGTDLKVDGCDVIDAKNNFVMPGFIDIHIHGYKGFDVSDADENGTIEISKQIAKNGVTSWCPTTMTVEKSVIQKSLDIIKRLINSDKTGAKILGANVEGPFINPIKKGAQSEKYILKPDKNFILKNNDAIKLVTLAPEMDENFEFIKEVSQKTGITVSIGHTTADYKTASAAIKCGARHITHLFNAMPPLNHRETGVVGAALENDSVTCEIIADTFHISPSLFIPLHRIKGDNLILITDCMRAGGMEEGEYTLGGQSVTVKGIECRLSDGTIAGSILTLNKAVKNFYKITKLPIYEVVKKASLSPAKAVGEDKLCGSLAVGKAADIVVADEKINIKRTIISGNDIYEKTQGI